MLKIWEAKVNRKHWKMKPSDRLCEKHFHKEDIIDKMEIEVNGQKIVEKFKHKRLRDDAIPVFFSHKKPPPPKRKPPAPREASVPATKRPRQIQKCQDNVEKLENERTADRASMESMHIQDSSDSLEVRANEADNVEVEREPVVEDSAPVETFLQKIHKKPESVVLPNDWIMRNKEDLKFIHVNDKTVKIDKYITLEKDKDVAKVFLNYTEVKQLQHKLENLEQTGAFIKKVDSLILCPGTGLEKASKADSCQLYFENNENKPPLRCHNCLLKRKAIQRSIKRKEVASRKKLAKIKHTQRLVRTQRLKVSKNNATNYFFLILNPHTNFLLMTRFFPDSYSSGEAGQPNEKV